MMQGFGVHTFRFVDSEGRGTFVKFHWTPVLGTHSLQWDEAQKIQGKDPDFNRRDLWEAIAEGAYPEFELGVQLVPESDEFAFDIDLLDATKIIPEEEVPVRPVGKMVLTHNPSNFTTRRRSRATRSGSGPRASRNGAARVAGDGDGLTEDRGVISAAGTDGSLPQVFVDSFCTALGKHRSWERPTAAVPA